MTGANILSIENLSVRFGGVKALTDITIDIPENGVFGLIGPNGAGKTTLFNSISGFVTPTPDSVVSYQGANIVGLPIHRVARLGIARTFQNISLAMDQTVEENIMSGFFNSARYSAVASLLPTRRVIATEMASRRELARVADQLSIPRRLLSQEVSSLSIGLQKKVEVARAMVRKPRVLMLDEPAGGLNDVETAELVASLKLLAQDPDLTLVVVDHDMSLVMNLCDRIGVLNFGQLVTVGTPAEVQANETVRAVYLGAPDAA